MTVMTKEQIEALKADVMTLEHLGGLWLLLCGFIALGMMLDERP